MQAHSNTTPIINPPKQANMSSSEEVRPIARPSLIRPLSDHSTAEGSKSRLVQPRYSTRSSILVNTNSQVADSDEPPSPTKVSRGTSESTKPIAGVSAEGTMPTRLRPRSMYQTGSATPQRVEQGVRSNLKSMRPPPPPGVPSQSTRPLGATSHSRTQSVNAAVALRRETAKSGVVSERPKSLIGAPSISSRTNGPSADIAVSSGSVPGRLAGLRRSASTKAKPEKVSHGSDTRPASRPDEPAVIQTGRRDGVPEGPKKTSRPAFSTLQQHFTPRKTGKAPTATFLHPAPVTGSQTLPPEISNLQTELLQLHLLHQSCNDVYKQWQLSAKRHFRTRFEEVASLHQTMLDHERAGQEQKNLHSLVEWSSAKTSSKGLTEHIQLLSEPLHELPSLVEPGGRLQRLVGEFEHWVSWVQDVRRARQDANSNMTASRTIDGLGDPWKAENTALVRKLTSFARALDGLDDPAPGSSLLCIVESCKVLLRGVVEELRVMSMVEAGVVAKEKFWVEDRLKGIARGIGMDGAGGREEVAAWRG
ncbi:hypothetical protein T440DRAFT_4410 [Plenodomus tracheiphilus IPT5]|uniref:Uncharacterized protein n=1 Tax=Plenodomus tracheiphilus IPT5 TaxID=1408161 RepID=A0A6A7BQI4_9PLEO|nr:hypothetical protein T440DRAFT_4410 [Plenodomus tracheiphilus IPT5]